MGASLEIKLFNLIKETYKEIVDMRPEDGFSSPRDYELVTEVNKKSAILDKLQEAIRIINPDFNYEPSTKSYIDFSLNPRFDKDWKQKSEKSRFKDDGMRMKKKFENYDFNQDYLNTWRERSNVTDIKTILIPYVFNFRESDDKCKLIPSILKEIARRNLSDKKLFLFNIVESDVVIDREYGNIPYEELRHMFIYHSNLDIEPLGTKLKDYYLMVLTKSNNINGVRFFFKIIFDKEYLDDKKEQDLNMKSVNEDNIANMIKERIDNFELNVDINETGSIISYADGVAEVYGLKNVLVGELVEFDTEDRGIITQVNDISSTVVILGKGEKLDTGSSAKRLHKTIEPPFIGMSLEEAYKKFSSLSHLNTKEKRMYENNDTIKYFTKHRKKRK